MDATTSEPAVAFSQQSTEKTNTGAVVENEVDEVQVVSDTDVSKIVVAQDGEEEQQLKEQQPKVRLTKAQKKANKKERYAERKGVIKKYKRDKKKQDRKDFLVDCFANEEIKKTFFSRAKKVMKENEKRVERFVHKSSLFGRPRIVINCSFCDDMNESELKSLSKQIMLSNTVLKENCKDYSVNVRNLLTHKSGIKKLMTMDGIVNSPDKEQDKMNNGDVIKSTSGINNTATNNNDDNDKTNEKDEVYGSGYGTMFQLHCTSLGPDSKIYDCYNNESERESFNFKKWKIHLHKEPYWTLDFDKVDRELLVKAKLYKQQLQRQKNKKVDDVSNNNGLQQQQEQQDSIEPSSSSCTTTTTNTGTDMDVGKEKCIQESESNNKVHLLETKEIEKAATTTTATTTSIAEFTDEEIGFKKHQGIVILTPDAKEYLKDVCEDKIYIIGGSVDKTVIAGQTYGQSLQEGIAKVVEKRVRLPIKEFAPKGSSKVLNIDTVVKMLCMKYDGKTWREIMNDCLPKRHHGALRDPKKARRRKNNQERIQTAANNDDAEQNKQAENNQSAGNIDISLSNESSATANTTTTTTTTTTTASTVEPKSNDAMETEAQTSSGSSDIKTTPTTIATTDIETNLDTGLDGIETVTPDSKRAKVVS